MRLCLISDTHNMHSQLKIPGCDILIHAGDESYHGERRELEQFAEWFEAQPAKYLVWIPGNHSLGFEKFYPRSKDWILCKSPRTNILVNESVVLDGIKIWGSPVTPRCYDWAYNVQRGSLIREYWERIPLDTDIVVTHGPPYFILDEASPGTLRAHRVGCDDLATVIRKVKPKLHVFGHIHDGHGEMRIDGTTYVNASVVDDRYIVVHEPTLLDYDAL